MADRVADMVGVNTHISFYGTVYDTHFETVIKPRLLELGVRHIRDSPSVATEPVVKSRFIDLAKSGVRTLMINWPVPDLGHAYVKALNAQAGLQVVEAVEPPNERDITWFYYNFGADWPAKMRDWMTRNYPLYKNDPATANITVLGPSFANTRDSAQILARVFPNAAAFMDAGNLHNYSGVHPEGPWGGGWGLSVADSLQRYRSLSGSKPLWVTENGYKQSGFIEGHPAVTPRAAAKYMPRQLLTQFQQGVQRYYIYELMNETYEDFGLLNNDGTPRPQFRAVKNLIALFKDQGASFSTGSLDYQLLGDLSSIYSSLFQKRNGRFYLALWQGVPSASGTRDSNLRNLEPPARSLTLNLATKITQARVYQPSFSTLPTSTYRAASGLASIPLFVPDHVLVVELIP